MLVNEKRIIKDLKNGSEKAFEILYNEYSHLIFFIVFQILKDKENAHDIVNDTFMAMYNNICQHDENKNFKFWLISIAKNKAYQYLKNAKLTRTYNDNEYIYYQGKEPDDSWMIIQTCQQVLTEIEYQILVYHVIYNLKFTDIANITQMSKSQAHRIYHEAIKKVRKEMR